VPTKRQPIHRQHSQSLQVVLPLFQHALRARAKWKRSRSDANYSAAVEAQKDVDRALYGPSRLWKVSIFDVLDGIYDRIKPPSERRQFDAWTDAVALLQVLEQLDREQREAERAAQNASNSTVAEPEPEQEEPTVHAAPSEEPR
jgi:hypothetical protein